MLQSTQVQRVGHNLITDQQHNHVSALSSRFYLAHSLVCSLSFHNYSVLPVVSRVCSMSVPWHMYRWTFKTIVTACAGTPAGGPGPVGFCVFYVLSVSCCFCEFRKRDMFCVFLTTSSPACQVHKRSEEGRGRGRGHSHAVL